MDSGDDYSENPLVVDQTAKMAANFHRVLDYLEQEYDLPEHSVTGYTDFSDQYDRFVNDNTPLAAVKYRIESGGEELTVVWGARKYGRKEELQKMVGHPPTDPGWTNRQIFLEYIDGSKPVFEGIDAGMTEFIGTVADETYRPDKGIGLEGALEVDETTGEVEELEHEDTKDDTPFRTFTFIDLPAEPRERTRRVVGKEETDEEALEEFDKALKELIEDSLD